MRSRHSQHGAVDPWSFDGDASIICRCVSQRAERRGAPGSRDAQTKTDRHGRLGWGTKYGLYPSRGRGAARGQKGDMATRAGRPDAAGAKGDMATRAGRPDAAGAKGGHGNTGRTPRCSDRRRGDMATRAARPDAAGAKGDMATRAARPDAAGASGVWQHGPHAQMQLSLRASHSIKIIVQWNWTWGGVSVYRRPSWVVCGPSWFLRVRPL